MPGIFTAIFTHYFSPLFFLLGVFKFLTVAMLCRNRYWKYCYLVSTPNREWTVAGFGSPKQLDQVSGWLVIHTIGIENTGHFFEHCTNFEFW